MISIYTGIPGSGKTYHAVTQIINYIKAGRRVYTNIRGIKGEEIAKFLDWSIYEHLLYILDDDEIKKCYLYLPNNSLLVLDEYQNIYPVTDYAVNTSAVNFFTTHRHKGIDVILITQSTSLGEKRLTALSEEYHDFRKLSFLGASNRYRHACFMGATDNQQAHMYTKICKYDPRVFKIYSSYVEDEVQEQTKKQTIYSNPKIIGFFILAIFLIMFLLTKIQTSNFSAFTSKAQTDTTKNEFKNDSLKSTSPAEKNDSLSYGRAFYASWGDTTWLDSAEHVQKP